MHLRQLLTGCVRQSRTHFVIVGLAIDDARDVAAEGGFSGRVLRLTLQFLRRFVCDLLCRIGVNALHCGVSPALTQDQGGGLSLRIGEKTDLSIDDFEEEFGVAVRVEGDRRLSGQLRGQLLPR